MLTLMLPLLIITYSCIILVLTVCYMQEKHISKLSSVDYYDSTHINFKISANYLKLVMWFGTYTFSGHPD